MDDFEEGRCYSPDMASMAFSYGRNIRARKTLWMGSDGCIYVTKKDALTVNGEKSVVAKMQWDSVKRRYIKTIK